MAVLDKDGVIHFWSKIKAKLDGKAENVHSHGKADITDFPTQWEWSKISGNPISLPDNVKITVPYEHSLINISNANANSNFDISQNSNVYICNSKLNIDDFEIGNDSNMKHDSIKFYKPYGVKFYYTGMSGGETLKNYANEILDVIIMYLDKDNATFQTQTVRLKVDEQLKLTFTSYTALIVIWTCHHYH